MTNHTDQFLRRYKSVVSQILSLAESCRGRGFDWQTYLAAMAEVKIAETPWGLFLYAAEAFRLFERFGGLTEDQVGELREVLESYLEMEQLSPGHADEALLLSHYFEAKGAMAAVTGDFSQASFYQEMAFQLNLDSDEFSASTHLYLLGCRYERILRLKPAMQVFSGIEHDGKSTPLKRLRAKLRRIQLLRYLGRFDDAKHLLQKVKQAARSSEVLPRIQWENCCLQVTRDGRVDAVGALFMMSRLEWPLEKFLEGHLWIYASGDFKWTARLPKLSTLRQRFGAALQDHPTRERLVQAVEAIGTFHDRSISLDDRKLKLLQAYSQRQKLPTIEQELLFTAATLRAVANLPQLMLRHAVVDDYRRLSFNLSGGERPDVTGLLQDLLDTDSKSLAKSPTRFFEPQTKARRMTNFTKAAGSIALTKIGSRVGIFFADKKDRRRLKQIEDIKIARLFLEELAGVRGVATKLAQMLSFCDTELPDSIRAGLSFAQDNLEPMPSSALERIFDEDFGKGPEQIYSYWIRRPIAAASISQVHQAWLGDRKCVAKVRYPNVESNIMTDLSNAPLIRNVLSAVFPSDVIDGVFEEFCEGMTRETDFTRELASIQKFAHAFAGNDKLWVPEVQPDFCSENVITMELLDGIPFYEFLTVASLEERNSIGKTIFDFYLRSTLQHGLVYGDPQPGNLLIGSGAEVMVCDYGDVGFLNPEEVDFYRSWIRGLVTDNYSEFEVAAKHLNYVAKNNTQFDLRQEFDALRGAYIEPLLSDRSLKISAVNLSRMVSGHSRLPEGYKAGVKRPHKVFAGRSWLQLFFTLALLEAEGNWRRQFLDILDSKAQTHEIEPAV